MTNSPESAHNAAGQGQYHRRRPGESVVTVTVVSGIQYVTRLPAKGVEPQMHEHQSHLPRSGGNILSRIVPNGSSAVVVPQSRTPNAAFSVANATRSTAQVIVLRNGTVIRNQPVPSFGQLSFQLTATRYRF